MAITYKTMVNINKTDNTISQLEESSSLSTIVTS